MSRSDAAISAQPAETSLSDDEVAADAPRHGLAGRSLKKVAVHGAAWTLLGNGSEQVLRLGTHVVLAWLLDPAVFGLMVMVDIVLNGLKMFSDVGTGPSIVQHKRGDEPAFLNTAWTIQVMRHGSLFIGACLLAWPVALYRDQPLLLLLLPVAALTTLLDGFATTAPSTLHRNMRLRELTLFELGVHVLRSGSTIALAALLRNVWALVLGGVIGAIVRFLGTHTVICQGRNRFQWDRPAVKDLVRFGRWIFIATALTFLLTHGDKLVMGSFLTDTELGLYAIAFWLALAAPQALRQVSNRVLFPIYSYIGDQPPHVLRRKILRAKVPLQAVTLPALCAVAIWSQQLVDFIYPDRYEGLAWILRFLAFGGVFRVMELTTSPILLAKGDSFSHMCVLVSQSIVLIAAMLVGAVLDGYVGLVIGISFAHALNYPVLAWAVNRYGVWTCWSDLAFMTGSCVFFTIGVLFLS